MNEDRGIELLQPFSRQHRAMDDRDCGNRAVTMIVRIDMRADFDSAQTHIAHTTLQLARGKIDILQRNCRRGRQTDRDDRAQLRQCDRLAFARNRVRPEVSPSN